MAHAARAVAHRGDPAEAGCAEAAAGCQDAHSVRVAASVRRLTSLKQHCGAHAAVDSHAALQLVRQGALRDAMRSAGLLYVPPGALSGMLRDSGALFGGAGSGAHTLLQLCDSVPQPLAAERADAWLSSQAAPLPVSAPPRARRRRKGKASAQAAGAGEGAQPAPVAQAAVPQQPGQAGQAAAPEAAGGLAQASASGAAGGQQPAVGAQVAPQRGEKGTELGRSQAPAAAVPQGAEASCGAGAGASEPVVAAELPAADGNTQQLPVREERGAEEALAKRWEKKRKGRAHAAAAELGTSHEAAGGPAVEPSAAVSAPSGVVAAELLAADAFPGTGDYWAPPAKVAAPSSAAADVAQILLDRGLADQGLEQALPGQGPAPGCEAGAEAQAPQQPLSVTDHRAQRRLMRKQARALLGSLMGSGGSISVLARAKAELEAQAAKVRRCGSYWACLGSACFGSRGR